MKKKSYYVTDAGDYCQTTILFVVGEDDKEENDK